MLPASGLGEADRALIAAAEAVLRRHYRPFWHTVSAALRDRSGRVFTGLHLGASVGRLAVCAESVALGRAVLEGDDGIEAIVALRHAKPDEAAREIAIASPCGACRELILDYDPEARVILAGPDGPVLRPVATLLPAPYRRQHPPRT